MYNKLDWASANKIITDNTEEISSDGFVNNPLLSICLITYNHGELIEQALEGVVMQVTDFPVEIVIGDDESTDETSDILIQYQKRYSDRVKVLRSTKNLGQLTGMTFQLNLVRNLRACRGKYIAMLEGDDYWTDPLKLQKQVDFMEQNPDCSMCFHAVSVMRNGGLLKGSMPSMHLQNRFFTEDMFTHCFIPTCSMVYRNIVELPSWFLDVISGDIPLHFLLAEKGNLFFMKEKMGVYRLHPGGLSNSHVGYHKAIGMMRIYNYLDQRYDCKYRNLIDREIEYEIDRHVVQPAVREASINLAKISGKQMIRELVARALSRLRIKR